MNALIDWFSKKVLVSRRSILVSRRIIQIIFTLIVIHIGFRFHQFISQLELGLLPELPRSPGVEAFLPISALVSLKHTLLTGSINQIHPSGFVIFLIICLTACIAKKAFCSWVCPIGLLSEYLNKLHLLIFKRPLTLPLWVDYILRSLKYIIFGFFAWSIFFKMPIRSIEQFIHSPYNIFADIKMYYFFTQISQTALIVLIGILILSIIIKNFWCRYLCPYGALLGLISFLSIGKIYRNKQNCTDCGNCEKHCPGMIKIREKELIYSSECTACLTCVQKCPEKNAIGFSLMQGKIKIRPIFIGFILLVLFTLGINMAKVTGHWQNKISNVQYLQHILNTTVPLGGKEMMNPEKRAQIMKIMGNIKKQQDAGLLQFD